MTTIDIACASDDRYVAHTAAMLHSVRQLTPDARMRVHWLAADEPGRKLRARLSDWGAGHGLGIEWVDVPPQLTVGLPSRDYLSRVVWYRVFMPQLLPHLDRVLYLDGDVIALDSIEPLWRTDLGADLFAAVTNVVPDYFAGRAAELGLPGPQAYFNLGVALWNLRAMRDEGFTAQVLRYAREHLPRLLWLEQDAINALYWGRRRPLHPRWNCQNAMIHRSWGVGLLEPRELAEALDRPALLHFEGGTFGKPWHLLSRHPYRDRYYFHRRHTPWPRVMPHGVTAKNLLQRYAPPPLLDWLRQVWR